jgi:hypothetical protein
MIIAEPKPFACPSCQGPIFDDWHSPNFGLEGWLPSPELEFWSDGVVTGAVSERRPIVACPLCICIFPSFSIQNRKSTSRAGAPDQLDPSTPYVAFVSDSENNADAPVDFNNRVKLPNWKHFRFLPTPESLKAKYDLLFLSLVAESALQSFNDKVRNRVRRGENVTSFIDEIIVSKFLKEFIQIRRGSGKEGLTLSDWAGASAYDFMGVARYFFLEVELERNLSNFEVAESDLGLVEFLVPNRIKLAQETLKHVAIDNSIDYPHIGSVNWELSLGLQRLEQSTTVIQQGVSGLRLLEMNLNSLSQL